MQPGNWAKQGIRFIEQLLPMTGHIVRKNDRLRSKMLQLAVKSQRTDWIQRLGAAAL